jgi:hypothetical protein
MSVTTKKATKLDFEGTLRSSFNDEDSTLTVNGFLVGKVGRKVELTTTSTTDEFSFKENGVLLYTILITYTDSTKAVLASAERTA